MDDRTKRNRVAVNLEDSVHEALQQIAHKEDLSASEYMRSLIIKDLVSRDLLPEATLHRLAGIRDG